jgi:hypothetical protein
MSTVVEPSTELEIPRKLGLLRTHAATVRALLDELERATLSSDRSARADRQRLLAEQVAEELAGLGWRMLDCAAVVSLLVADLARGHG